MLPDTQFDFTQEAVDGLMRVTGGSQTRQVTGRTTE